MRVNLNSVALDMQLEETFGRPIPTDYDVPEVFGPYHVPFGRNEGPKFWRFDPKDMTWDVIEDHVETTLPDDEETSDAGQLAAFRYLDMMERPPLPEDRKVRARSAPFWYEGWLFVWHYFPELRRWELAPVTSAARPAPTFTAY